jgi:hypothetical protein
MRKKVEIMKTNDPKQSSWIRRMLVEHPAFLVSGLYLVASLIGLVYSWAFLRAFGINVFRYAEISDFLLASLKEPFTWILAVLAVALVLFDNTMSRRVQARAPGRLIRWYGSERYRQINYLVLVFLVAFFLLTFATVNERNIRDGKAEAVHVFLTDGSPPKRLIMLGTTAKYVFLFDHVEERLDMHPHESILTITKMAPDSEKD